MNLHSRCLVTTLVSFSLISSCGKKQSENASPETNSTLAFTANQELQDISIRADYVGREFLMRTNLLQGGASVSFHGLKSRIVLFQREGKMLFLVESPKDLQVHDDLPQTMILARFPIVKEVGGRIHFDFNSGMNHLFTGMTDWYSKSADDTFESLVADRFKAQPIESSFIKHTENSEAGLEIWQSARALMDKETLPVEIRYNFKPYAPNTAFQAQNLSEKQRHFGYLTGFPKMSKGSVVSRIAKFDTSQPIVFYISANTPEDYRDVVREGVLYWNKALGAKILRVEEAPKGVTAPDYSRNVIQWVDWKGASSAYADMQMDPRTGEVLNAQVFLPSSFAVGNVADAKRVLRQLRANAVSFLEGPSDTSQILKDPKLLGVLRGQTEKQVRENTLEVASLCNHADLASYTNELERILKDNPTDELVTRFSKDALRDTVAHEIGHTLGLRHNFAGSLAANYETSDLNGILENYKNGSVPDDLVITSSVMDYLPFEASVISGRQILKNKEAFKYDSEAIQALYFSKKFQSKDLQPYCTDSDVKDYVDCSRFLVGKNPIAHSFWRVKQNLESIPTILANYWIQSLEATEPGVAWYPQGQSLAPQMLAARVLKNRWPALEAIQPGKRSVLLTNDESANFREGESPAYVTQVLNAVNNLGGWDKVLFPLDANFVSTQLAEFRAVFEEKLKDLKDAPVLTTEQRDQVERLSENYLRSFQQGFEELQIVQLSLVKSISDVNINADGLSLTDSLMPHYASLIRKILGTEDGFDQVRGYHPLKFGIPKTLDSELIDGKVFDFGASSGLLTLEKSFNNASAYVAEILHKSTPLAVPKTETSFAITWVPVDFKIRRFKYPEAIRATAASLLAGSPRSLNLSYAERRALAFDLKNTLNHDLYGLDIENMKLDMQPRLFAQWLASNLRILGTLRANNSND